ncbi:MAG: GHKL domain-containing protein [Clostridia bacterium]|nr:GHKL domain-containing protein [Clostridia bacterium]MBR2079691.1 GHKL domain-containing protein [Clostridia bacterium]
MLKKLRRRFVAIAMFALSIMFFVQLTAVNVINLYQRDSETKSILKVIADNNGVLPGGHENSNTLSDFLNPFGKLEINVETPYSTRYFVVELRKNVATKISTEHIAAVSEQTAYEYASEAYRKGPGFGTAGPYRYYYKAGAEKSIMVFIDITRDLKLSFALMTISATVTLITLLLILVPVWWLCKQALKPVEEAMEKQKQFITDAGHELKTPIAIINADAEVMELCQGENEWLTSIKKQTARMNTLVKNLVELSKLGEEADKKKHTIFDISEAVLDTASNFETTAKALGKSFTYSAARDIKYNGNEEEIRQLISILCDNAMKYTNENGTIKLNLYKVGKSIQIDVFNTCDYVDPAAVPRLFDRFYRADESRSRETGGYGIGLSVAKEIVLRHKGRIKVVTDGTTAITFKITL